MLLSTLPAGQGGAAPREALWEVALLGGGWGGGRLLSGSCAHSFLKVSLDAQQPQGLERPPPTAPHRSCSRQKGRPWAVAGQPQGLSQPAAHCRAGSSQGIS